jgi:3-oxoacyl-[acyl-carrier protein] reductase
MSLRGKWALVCGSSQGIGLAIAKSFASEGVNLVLIARDEDKLLKIKSELEKRVQIKILALDLTDLKVLEEKLNQLLINLEGIDILINNSGGPKAGPLIEADPKDFLSAFQSHVLAAHVISKSLLPKMKINKFGRIINIISTSVKIPISNLGVSNTIRGAMANWSKSMANEVAPWGITVNNVLPGYTKTERLDILKTNSSQRLGLSEGQLEQQWLDSIPAKRFAQPEEIAQAVLFLASQEASYINGINLPVDGGRTGCL